MFRPYGTGDSVGYSGSIDILCLTAHDSLLFVIRILKFFQRIDFLESNPVRD